MSASTQAQPLRWREVPAAAWVLARAHSWLPARLGALSLPYAAVLVLVVIAVRRDAWAAWGTGPRALAVLVLEPPPARRRPRAVSRLLGACAVLAVAVVAGAVTVWIPPAAWVGLQVTLVVLGALVGVELLPLIWKGARERRAARALEQRREEREAWLLHWVSAWPKGTGVGSHLVGSALGGVPTGEAVALSTRTARLRGWYGGYGFEVVDDVDEVGVMLR